MGADIEQLVLILDRLLYKQSAQHYVLVGFEDTDRGAVTTEVSTGDRGQFHDKYHALNPGLGGDCPEMFYTGLLRAIELSNPGSTCFVFTDAPAKDTWLKENAMGAAQEKSMRLQVYLSPGCGEPCWFGTSCSDTDTSCGETDCQHCPTTCTSSYYCKNASGPAYKTMNIEDRGGQLSCLEDSEQLSWYLESPDSDASIAKAWGGSFAAAPVIWEQPPPAVWEPPSSACPYCTPAPAGFNLLAKEYCEYRERVEQAGATFEGTKIRATLVWHNCNDLDLHVREPPGGQGHEIWYSDRVDDQTKGFLDVDANGGGCSTYSPVENVRFTSDPPSAPMKGRYEVAVWYYTQHDHMRETAWNLTVAHGVKFYSFSGFFNSATTSRQREHIFTFDFDPHEAFPVPYTEARAVRIKLGLLIGEFLSSAFGNAVKDAVTQYLCEPKKVRGACVYWVCPASACDNATSTGHCPTNDAAKEALGCVRGGTGRGNQHKCGTVDSAALQAAALLAPANDTGMYVDFDFPIGAPEGTEAIAKGRQDAIADLTADVIECLKGNTCALSTQDPKSVPVCVAPWVCIPPVGGWGDTPAPTPRPPPTPAPGAPGAPTPFPPTPAPTPTPPTPNPPGVTPAPPTPHPTPRPTPAPTPAPPTPAPTPHPTPVPTLPCCDVGTDTDVGGGVVAEFLDGLSEAGCCEKCHLYPECVAAVLVNATLGGGCYLKNESRHTWASVGRTFLMRNANPACWESPAPTPAPITPAPPPACTPVECFPPGDQRWVCSPKGAATTDALDAAEGYVCGSGGGVDCSPVQPGGLCYRVTHELGDERANELATARWVFNAFYVKDCQAAGDCDSPRAWACDFSGAGELLEHPTTACAHPVDPTPEPPPAPTPPPGPGPPTPPPGPGPARQVCLHAAGAAADALSGAVSWACDPTGGGVDCAAVNAGGACNLPDTVEAHSDYVFDKYYQVHKADGAGTCDFGGAAALSTCSTAATECAPCP